MEELIHSIPVYGAKAPELAGGSEEELTEFLLLRKEYYYRIKKVNAGLSETSQLKVRETRDMLTPTYLLTECKVGTFGIGVEPQEVTEEKILDWLNKLEKTYQERRISNFNAKVFMEAAKKAVRINYNLKGAAQKVQDLQRQLAKVGTTEELRLFMEYPKSVSEVYISSLRLGMVKDWVLGDINQREEVHIKVRKDPVEVLAIIQEALVVEEKFEKFSIKVTTVRLNEKNRVISKNPMKEKEVSLKDTKEKGKDEVALLPSGKRCRFCRKWGHIKKDCLQLQKKITEEKTNKETDHSLRSGKRYGETAKETEKKVAKVTTFPEKGKKEDLLISFDSKVVLPAIWDSGSDLDIISTDHLNLLKEKEVEFNEITVPEFRIQLADQRVEKKIYTKVTFKSIEYITTPGVLQLENLEFYVLDADMAQVILGQPIQKQLKIDPASHFRSLMEYEVLKTPGKQRVFQGTGRISNSPQDTQVKNVKLWTPPQWDDLKENDPHAIELLAVGEDNSKVDEVLKKMMERAVVSGLTKEGQKQAWKILQDHKDVFRTELGKDPPAKVEPYHLTMKPDSFPIIAPLRRFPPLHRDFLRNEMQKMVDIGLYYRNPTSKYALAVLVVPKPNGKGLRMAVDARPINAMTQPIAGVMTDLEAIFGEMVGFQCGFKLDLTSGYYQIPLAESSQEYFSVRTPDGVFTPTRLCTGGTDSVLYFQSVISGVLSNKSVSDFTKVWLDDIIGYSQTGEQDLLVKFEATLVRLKAYGFKLHPEKCDIFMKTLVWCGRVLSPQGISYDPARVEGLLTLPLPQDGAQLMEFVCCLNWMRLALPDYSRFMRPLEQLLQEVRKRTGSSKKRAARRIPLAALWTPELKEAFEDCKKRLKNITTLAFVRPDYQVCVFTDASDLGWGSVVTQIPPEQIQLPFEDQHHTPLAFLSGTFKNASLKWSVPEKEGFAIVETCTRLDYLLIRATPFLIYTDHLNLLTIFDPRRLALSLTKQASCRVNRWSVKLQQFSYKIVHIAGADNIWADLLSRFQPYASDTSSHILSPTCPVKEGEIKQVLALIRAPVYPSAQITWPSLRSLQHLQELAIQQGQEVPEECVLEEGGYKTNGKWWIPLWDNDAGKHMVHRLLVIAHMGEGGHRGYDATLQQLVSTFWWTTIKQDVRNFLKSCIHCLSTLSGTKIPRPLGVALHGSKPFEVIHMDYIFMQKTIGNSYILMIMDDWGGYCELVPTKGPRVYEAAEALAYWFARYQKPQYLISDGGSHFKNRVLEMVMREFGIQHHVTTADCAWANGTIERLGREVKRVMKALLSEWRITGENWCSLTPVVQKVLNHSYRRDLKAAPITATLGLETNEAWDAYVDPVCKTMHSVVDFFKEKLELKNDLIRAAETRISQGPPRLARRQPDPEAALKLPHFEVGTYVLEAMAKKTEKLKIVWRGPKRIVDTVNDWVYVVEDLLTKKKRKAHITRLQFYADEQLEVTADIMNHIRHHGSGYTLEEILDIKKNADGQYEVLVEWEGFEEDDTSWIRVSSLYKEDQQLLTAFLREVIIEGGKRGEYARAVLEEITESNSIQQSI